MDLEVRGAINVVEASAQTESLEKMVFTSSLTAAIWRENICSEKDVDERSWSDQAFCRKMKVCVCVLYIFCSVSRTFGNYGWDLLIAVWGTIISMAF